MAETIVRMYDDISEAYRVVDELVQAGYDRNDITLMAYDPEGTYADYVDVDYQQAQHVGEEAAVGAGVGAIIGGLGGLLVGLGALTIPGVGPIIAAGPIAAALIGAGTGATVGGLVGALVETGVPEERAEYYAEGVRRGGTLVMLHTREDLALRAEEIMDQYGAVDIEQRTTSWRARGWEGYNAEAEPYTMDEIEYEADYYNTYDPLFRQHYQANYSTSGYPYARYEPAYRYGYDLAYDERYMDRDWEEIEPEARREWERDNPDSAWENVKDAIEDAWNEVQNTFDFDDDYQSYDSTFRTHYADTYGATGRTYNYYEPAYRYGHSLAYDERYVDRDWDEIEPEARSEWEAEYGQGTWENVKDAVENAWDEVQSALDFEDESDVNIDYDYQEYEDYDYFAGRFRSHFNTTYGTTGYNYDYYEPAYRYGYDLATSERYGRRDWGEIETEARDLWEGRNEGTWDRFKDAVEHAWHEVKETLGMAEEEHTSRTTTQPGRFS